MTIMRSTCITASLPIQACLSTIIPTSVSFSECFGYAEFFVIGASSSYASVGSVSSISDQTKPAAGSPFSVAFSSTNQKWRWYHLDGIFLAV